jgi:uncharacterized oxidoreductase
MTKPTPTGAALHDPAAVLDLAIRILEAADADPVNARIVAEHLVEASLVGVDTHGIVQLSGYVRAIREGRLDPRATPTVDRETPVAGRVRGHWGFGHVAALEATRIGIAKATAVGCAAIAIVESGHIGRVGHFAELAADAGIISLLFAGGYGDVPRVAPFGGVKPVTGTNPIAFGFPGEPGGGPFFDFATTMVAGGKVTESLRLGRPMPAGALMDQEGRPSDDPQSMYTGGWLTPFGGHKGYSILIAAEWLGRIATGADDYFVSSHGEPMSRQQGILGIFLRADLFVDRATVDQRSADTASRIRAVPSVDGGEPVRIPGDGARSTRLQRSKTGIPIDVETWEGIQSLSRELGLQP